MIRGMLIVALIILSVRGEIEQRDVQKDSVEFSKLNTEAFKSKCAANKLISIKVDEMILGYACIPPSATLCSLNITCKFD